MIQRCVHHRPLTLMMPAALGRPFRDPLCADLTNSSTCSDVADPNTGMAVYATNSSGIGSWMIVGGTSASAPIIGGTPRCRCALGKRLAFGKTSGQQKPTGVALTCCPDQRASAPRPPSLRRPLRRRLPRPRLLRSRCPGSVPRRRRPRAAVRRGARRQRPRVVPTRGEKLPVPGASGL